MFRNFFDNRTDHGDPGVFAALGSGLRITTRQACKKFIRHIAAVTLLTTLVACSGPFSTLEPAGPAAASTAKLWWVMLAGATALLGLVLVSIAAAFIRPGLGRGTPASLWIVGGGLILPAVVLTPLMVYALASGERLFQARGEGRVQVHVLARQWEWIFTYRAPDGATRASRNVLHIPAAHPVRLNITSADVIHSFWVPKLAGKIDATPGHMTMLRLSADNPGLYRGLCAEFCGTAHWEMQMVVEAHPSMEDFERAIAQLPLANERKHEGQEHNRE